MPLDFNGVPVQVDVEGKRSATGVSDAVGSVPRFGETIVDVPVSVSLFRLAHHAIGVMADEYRGRRGHELSEKLTGPALNSERFKSSGEFALPAEIFERGK